MAKKKTRDCTKCIAYCNMLGGEENLCGLGFEVVEDVEGRYGSWDVENISFCSSVSVIDSSNGHVRFNSLARF